MFSDEGSARARFEARVWPEGRLCPRCGSGRTGVASHRTMPYWCTGCRSYFSVRTGTVMEASNLRFGCGCWRSIWIFLPGMASGCWSCAGLLGSLWMPPGSCRRGSARRAGSPVEADEIAAGESEGARRRLGSPRSRSGSLSGLVCCRHPRRRARSRRQRCTATGRASTSSARRQSSVSNGVRPRSPPGESLRGLGIVERMGVVTSRMVGIRLRYTDLAG